MLLPDERASDFEDPDRVWALLEPWYRPQDGPLTRSAVYEFRSMLSNQMRSGRALLVGDAAHLTPPFLGQGLCSGVRDAANLAWKLDLVLRGLAPARLLDTIEPERQPQNEAIIRLAIELGKVLCQLDPQAAAERDAMLRQAEAPPPLDLPPLNDGVLHRPVGSASDPLAGTLGVQGVVRRAGREGRFDDVVGRGFQLIVAAGDPLGELSSEQRALIDALDMSVASLDPAAPERRPRRRRPAHGVADRARRPRRARAPRLLRVRQLPLGWRAAGASRRPSIPASADLHIRHRRSPPMTDTAATIHPKFHHFNLKTTRLQEMIDFYRTLVGAEVIHQFEGGAWLTNDAANHRIALLAFPDFVDDPEKETRTGMHHSAFEYASFDELNSSYLRLKEQEITPALCLDHGMTLSYYYVDPDGNHVELQVDCFGDWEKSTEWMRTSEEFKANPIGVFVDPDQIAADHADGMTFEQIHAKAMAGGYAPEQAPVEIPEAAR